MAKDVNATNNGVPSTNTSGDVFAVYGPSTPTWRKIVKVEGTQEGGFVTSVVQDYTLDKAIADAIQKAWSDEFADADDTPDEQQLLMTAWQALATYASTCDDEDKAGALIALKFVSNLMAGGEADGPLPTGTFGVTQQWAATEYSCPKCTRNFSTEQGLIGHLAKLHNQREHQTTNKTETD